MTIVLQQNFISNNKTVYLIFFEKMSTMNLYLYLITPFNYEL